MPRVKPRAKDAPAACVTFGCHIDPGIASSDVTLAPRVLSDRAVVHGGSVSPIRADIAAGVLRQDFDADASVSLLVEAYLGKLVRRGRVDDDLAERCVELMWVAMTGRSPTGS